MSQRSPLPASLVRCQVARATALALLLSVFAVFGPQPASAAEGTVRVRVPAGQSPAVAALALAPRRDLDYGAFRWLELDPADAARLAASGVAFVPVPGAGTVQVLDFRFDPLVDGEPAVPAALAVPGDGPGLRLVQLVAPLRHEWQAPLTRAGVRLLQYYPHHTYLTWTEGGTGESLAGLDFVRWHGRFHPAYKVAPELRGRQGVIENVELLIYNRGGVRAVLDAVAALGGEVLQHFPAQPDRAFVSAIVRLDGGAVTGAARLPEVAWVGFASPQGELEDEMSSQIVAGNHPGGVPEVGYEPWLADLGFDGSGVVWAVTDSGVDLAHPDLDVVGGFSTPGCPGDGPGDDPSFGGHGTHVAGILGGDATGGFTDAGGFLYGLGVAPGVGIFAQSVLCIFQDSWPPPAGWPELSRQGVEAGAVGSNSSWGVGIGISRGYHSIERTYDFMARDGDFTTGGTAEPYIFVFSAGNAGPGPETLTSPKEAKNLISVGSSVNFRSGSIDDVALSSSRGPTADGRNAPTVVAPGMTVTSTRNSAGGFACATPIAGTDNLYALCSGTSMASPHASGALAVITQWWRGMNDGADPSPAMARALLVDGAVDIAGAPAVPNFVEGWGRVSLPGVIDYGVNRVYRDQLDRFVATGEAVDLTVRVADPDRPLRVTLAWTDAPGAVGASPALVNDLDLRVEHDGAVLLGNQLAGGASVAGGAPDALNNLESVRIAAPSAETATITVEAAHLAGDGVPYDGDAFDQDFALVCTNCTLLPDFALVAAPTRLDLCAPADAVVGVDVASVLGFGTPVALSLVGAPTGTATDWSVNPVTPSGSSVLTLSGTGDAVPGVYPLTITGTAGGREHDREVVLGIYDAAPGTPVLTAPTDGASGVALSPTLVWSAATQGATYVVEVASDPAFTDVVYSAAVSGVEHTLTASLAPETGYFWRTRAENPCGAGVVSSAFSFTTRAVPGILLIDDDDNLPDVRAIYTDALDALGMGYDVWDTDNGDVEPASYQLAPYRAAVWFTGDSFDSTAGPGTPGEEALAAYLEGGGCLLLASQDGLFVRGLSPFYSGPLGLASFGQDFSYSSVLGAGPFDGLGSYALADDTPIFNFADVLEPDATAEPAFTSPFGTAAIVKDAGAYRAVFLGFDLASLSPTAAAEILDRAWRYCEDLHGVFADGFESGDLSAWSAATGD